MTIKRMYSLPYCTITLQGLSNEVDITGRAIEAFPVMSILLNAECYFAHCDQSMSGGKQFLESLVQTVSQYAQEFLSPIPYPRNQKTPKAEVELTKIPQQDLHRLSLSATTEEDPTVGKMHIDLTTVQLFDLVEAVDQFLVDSHTLPDVVVPLSSLPHRLAHPEEPLAQRSIPVILGVTSLSLASILFFLIPAPLPKPVESIESNNSNTTEQPTPSPTVTPATPPSPTPSASITPSPSPRAADLEALLTTNPEITDANKLRLIQTIVYENIFQNWQNRSEIAEDITYQIGVLEDGALVGYQPVNQSAGSKVDQTPLPKLLSIPNNSSDLATKAIAQFRVVFTRRGVLQISPWRGYSEPVSNTPRPEITDSAKLAELNQTLAKILRESWTTEPDYPRDLTYRVALTEDGKVTDFEPLNQPAFDYLDQTPLQKLRSSTNPTDSLQKSVGQFQVVFKTTGGLEVSPMRGF
ncbi:MAG: DUF4335 domain-containing protein [Coleofasciculaceae cyanobacterium SM2_1_6]|nr:DUF4335 domain-containing protein [Coleofasciculaceae cyanobacterium SM2_1_6]